MIELQRDNPIAEFRVVGFFVDENLINSGL